MNKQPQNLKEIDTLRPDGTYEIDDEDDGFEYDDASDIGIEKDYTTQS